MDHARSGRVARPVWFDAGMERALIAQGEIEQGIRFGLEHGQFVPYFEPQVDLATGEIVGFEVLARWNHPLSGIIGPDVFIPVAEEIGADRPAVRAGHRRGAARGGDWDPAIKISVNISPIAACRRLACPADRPDLAEPAFPAERLVVEITESSLFADMDLARTIVTSLKNQGIRLALDDFGTGFSSLAHLRSLPFDIIKIDRSFVTNINAKRESIAIVRAVTTLAEALRCRSASRASRTRRPTKPSSRSAARSARAGISASRCRPSRRASCSPRASRSDEPPAVAHAANG